MYKVAYKPLSLIEVYSEWDVKELWGEGGAAEANIITVFLCFAVGDAFGQLGPRAKEDTTDTAENRDVLLGVLVVKKLSELSEQGADIAVSVDDVSCLSQTNVTDLELGKLLRVVKVNVIDDREGAADGVSQATAASFIEAGCEAINYAKKQELPVLCSVFDKLLGTSKINFVSNFRRDLVWDLVFNTLLESEVLGSPTGGGEVRTSSALMVVWFLDDSVDINAFLVV